MKYKANQLSSKINCKTSLQKASLINMGCPKNQVLAEKIIFLLQQNGYLYEAFHFSKPFDYLFVNTCGFLASARAETDSVLQQLEKYKRCFPSAKIVVLGCDASYRAAQLSTSYPDFTFLSDREVLSSITRFLKMESRSIPFQSISNQYHAYLQIADGCDHHCSYCLIPAIKGKYESVSQKVLIQQIKNILQRFSVKEIILIAQDTSAYGHDLTDRQTLHDLVCRMAEIQELEWIRCLYLYPTADLSFFQNLLSIRKVVPYLDIPLQHVSKKILRAMNRPYRDDSFIDNLFTLKKQYPLLTIRTTFIVGFPGETEYEYQELLDALQQYQFDRVGFFAFSAEPGTKAEMMEGSLSEEIKAYRLKKAYETQRSLAEKANQTLLHQRIPVLIEKYDPIRKQFIGRCYREAPDIDPQVQIKTDGSYPRKYCGQIKMMEVTNADAYTIKGRLITE